MKRWQVTCAALVALATAGSGLAIFRAADLVIVPIAAATPGLENSNWFSDLEIRNVDTVPIDIEIVLLPSGGSSNVNWFGTFANHLGGRSEDGFTKVDERLKDIAPGGVVILENVVGETWGDYYKGALLIFAYEAGTFTTTDPPGGVPRKIVATCRTYTLREEDPAEEGQEPIPFTNGQAVPGLPWYYYIDVSQTEKGLDKVVFTGIREDADFRTNIGVVNISDPLTYVQVLLTLKDAAGEVLEETGLLLNPLAHRQFDQAVRDLFGLTEEDLPSLVGGTLTVAVTGWQSTAETVTPALMAYVSRVDNHTNDPVYIEQVFDMELPWDCVFNDNCSAAKASSSEGRRPGRRRPLAPPGP